MLSSLQRPEAITNSDLFDLIYQAALDEDKEMLDTYLLPLTSIDTEKKLFTPASKLASEGHRAAVRFLIDNYNVSLERIAYGYALGNFTADAYGILALAATPARRIAILKSMAMGFAQANNAPESDRLQRLARTTRESFALLKARACGYVLAGRDIQANQTLDLAALPADRFAIMTELAHAYAYTHHVTSANTVLALTETSAQRLRILMSITIGSAHGGNADGVRNIVDDLEMPTRFEFLKAAATGFARTGDIQAAARMIRINNPARRHALWCAIATGLAMGGHVNHAMTVFDFDNSPEEKLNFLKAVIYGFALGKHVDDASTVLELAGTPGEKLLLAQEMLRGYAEKGHIDEAVNVLTLFDQQNRTPLLEIFTASVLVQELFLSEATALHTLAIIPDQQLTTDIATRMQLLPAFGSLQISALLPRAIRINHVMKAYELSFEQASNWIHQEVQILLLQFPQMINDDKLNADVLILIARFLTSPPLTHDQAIDLGNKFSQHLVGHRIRLFTIPQTGTQPSPDNTLTVPAAINNARH